MLTSSSRVREKQMDSELRAFEERLNKKIDQRFDQVDQRFDDLNQRVGVLHEEAMAEFRFSLEAVQGAKEELSRKFDARADSLESTLELIARAVKANLPRAGKA